MNDNPFERYDIDPREGPQGITERLRELAEETSGAERDAVRAAWEELTKNPLRRAELAISAAPETRRELGVPPLRSAEDLPELVPIERSALEPSDLLAPPRLLAILGGSVDAIRLPLPPADADPALTEP